MKCLLDALFLSTYTLHILFVSIMLLRQHTTYVTYIIRINNVVTAKNVWILKQVSLIHVTVITLIGLYPFIHLIHSVHNNVRVHSFIY